MPDLGRGAWPSGSACSTPPPRPGPAVADACQVDMRA
ncbi:hypothetical protein JOE68_001844 [Saccharothrix algeriensis]|uniref:Uncharacterized protein n=1 Tax=Saccharothrix algeriensis TaxID=173560 RepID=A0ABS2S4X3_9PSEU|nr:hypothetical protein [Saccharothrix algeriensis]